eukprot:m.252058 g.252058  ORF g.252058 m.252058 type:complete len:190 (+) comp19549_c0_seq20:293-862(+)
MEAACEKFASGFDAYQTRLKQYAADVTSLELLAAEHQQLREKYTEQQEKFGAFDCTSVAELEDRCARAKEQQIAAEVELRNETAAVVALEAQIEALDAALLTADSARSAAAAKSELLQRQRQHEGAGAVEQAKWYGDVARCIAQLGGMTVTSATAQDLFIVLSPTKVLPTWGVGCPCAAQLRLSSDAVR